MQYQPGSWYLPWGIPLQKMLTMQTYMQGSPNATTIQPFAGTSNPSLNCHLLSGQSQGNVNGNISNSLQVQATTGTAVYQHVNYNQGTVGSYTCPNSVRNLQHNPSGISVQRAPGHTILNGHTHGLLQSNQLPSSHPQHQNALLSSTILSPHALRSFVTSSTTAMNNPITAISDPQPILSDCAQIINQQPSQVNSTASSMSSVAESSSHPTLQTMPTSINLNVDVVAMQPHVNHLNANNNLPLSLIKLLPCIDQQKEKKKILCIEKRKAEDNEQLRDLKKAKLETKALKAKRPGFTDERYHETSYFIENGLRKVYPYYFTFTTFTKGRWVGEKILDVFAREFRAHPSEEYERCIKSGTLTVNYEHVPTDYRLKHNDLLANIVHRHEVPVTCEPITIVHMDDDIVVVNKPASIPVHPCGRYRHNTVVFILAKEFNLKNLRTIHRLDRLTSGLLLFGRSPKKARQLEHQIRNRQVEKEYICRVEGNFPEGIVECHEPIEVVSYKIGVCKVSSKGKDCTTTFKKLSYNGKSSVVLCKPLTGRMHQIRVHLQYLGFPVANDPLYNHEVFGPHKGRGGDIGGKSDDELVRDLINIHNAENWLGIDNDSDISMFKSIKGDCNIDSPSIGNSLNDEDSEVLSCETPPVSSSSPTILYVSDDFQSAHSYTVESSTKDCHVKASSNDGSASTNVKVTVATQTGQESPDMTFSSEKMSIDKHCYECKVRYRDPKQKDLVMYLHAWKYKGPGWEYETKLPNWGKSDWVEL